MPQKWLRYTVLPVGQGAGAFVQVWEGPQLFEEATARPIEAALIDLGSLGWKRTAGAASARFVADQLKKMASPALDAVFLSHSDSDHTNLLKNLLEYFDPPGTVNPGKPVLTVASSWFGGHEDDYYKSNNDPLGLLRRYGPAPNGLDAGASSWPRRGPGPPNPLHRTDNIGYFLLIGNTQAPGDYVDEEDELPVRPADDDPPRGVKRPRESDSFTRNVVSMVLVVAYGSAQRRRIVATGDATGLTLACANSVIKASSIQLAPVYTISLPHHGSETSTYDLTGSGSKKARDEVKAEQVVADFVSNTRPESITASAAERSTFRHPASRVIAAFAESVGSGMYREDGLGDEHFFTAHYPKDGLPLTNLRPDPDAMEVDNWPPNEGWYTGHTKRNVFTIDYTREDPRGVDLAAISYAPEAPAAESKASLGGLVLPGTERLPPRAAGWGFCVSADGAQGKLERLVDLASVTASARAALEAVHGPLPPERFVFIPSAPEPAAEQPPPPPAVVPEAPRRRARSDLPRRPRQLP